MKLPIAARLYLDTEEVQTQAVRAAGPGGQNVNKVSSAIQLRFDVGASSLPAACKERLLAHRDRRISGDGVIVIKAQRFRDQERNRQDATQRLVELLRKALQTAKPRKATRPTLASKRRRLQAKSRRALVKALRGKPGPDS